MAKTQFVEGSYLTPTWCNSVYYTGGGHVHDGGSDDGHASLINLTSNVSGVLPQANMSWAPARGYIDGYQMSYTVGTYACSITVTEGTARDSTNAYNITATTSITKNIINAAGNAFVTWTVGNGGGGTAVISAAALWLHVFVIYNPVSDLTDIFLDTELNGSNRPITYTYVRRIGSIWIEDIGSGRFGIKKFRQYGDKFSWEAQNLSYSKVGSFAGNVLYDATMLSPVGVNADVYGAVKYNQSGTVTTLRMGNLNPPDEFLINSLGTPGSGSWQNSYFQLMTDTSSRLRLKEDGGGTGSSVVVYTSGYYDYRGKQ